MEHPRLIELALEEAEQLVDLAESRFREALDGDHKDRALSAAMFILNHIAWPGSVAGAGIAAIAMTLRGPRRPINVFWAGRPVPAPRLEPERSGGEARRHRGDYLASDDDRVH